MAKEARPWHWVPLNTSALLAALMSTVLWFAGSAQGQCNGRPLYLTAANSSGNLAFPEVNFDPHSGAWQRYQFYPTAVKCSWVLRAPPAHVLTAAFLHFDTEQDYDYVTIYSSEERTEQLLRVSGDLTDEWFVTSPEDTLVVDFISDDYTTYYGFLLAYRYEPQACVGGVTVAEEHLVAVPPMNLNGALPGPRLDKKPITVIQPKGGAGGRLSKDPEIGVGKTTLSWVPLIQYGPWINCTWRVAVDTRNIVQLDILRFDTGVNDLMKIWQVGEENWKVLLQYGGGDIPRRTFQSTKPLVVNFVSQAKDRGSGFLLNISYIMRACEPGSQELTAPRGTVAYPRHNLLDGEWRSEGHAHYGPDSCEWVVAAPEGYAINVTILKFDTRYEDKLEMLEGSKVVFDHGGEIPSKRSFISRGSNLTLRFNSLEDTDKTGFLLQYSWVLKDCESELESTDGELRSPYYPDIYGPNVTCRWKVTPPAGHLLHIFVARLRLDAGDTLQVSDGEKDLKVTGVPYQSGRLLELHPSPSVSLFFSSDLRHNKGYFLLKYTSFRKGSCDFQLSPCGWRSTDPLQAWAFHGSQGLVAVAEETGIGMQHPRGYRAILTSPEIIPDEAPSTPEGIPMCLRLDYLLNGPDAFLLTAAVTETPKDNPGKAVWLPTLRNLLLLYGPHGNTSITTAVNFTVSGPFRLNVVYERGYGPHYTVGLKGVQVKEGPCEGDLDSLTATTCSFTKDFCGWRNTHNDHRNWLLTDDGVMAEVRSGTVSAKPHLVNQPPSSMLEQQWADLISPSVTRDGIDGACLTLRYLILSENSELRVLLKPFESHGSLRSARRSHEGHEQKAVEERLLWSQGRVRSPSVMEALINLDGQDLPLKYQLILRAVGVGRGGSSGGVELRGVTLRSGSCDAGPSCSFDSGFCSWKVSYTGGTVWYISPHEGDDEEGSHAAVLVDGSPDDTTSLTSEVISSSSDPVSLTFRYRVLGTSKCLSVGQKEVGGTEAAPPNVIWKQCRGKGEHWLEECVALPSLPNDYQVVLTTGTGEKTTEVWVDDIQVVQSSCNVSISQSTPATSLATPPQWTCDPEGSLCGMSQPQFGQRDWVYIDAPPSDLDKSSNLSTASPVLSTTLAPDSFDSRLAPPPTEKSHTCADGTPLEAAWICDGIADCADLSDEEECECTDDGLECTSAEAVSSFHLGAGVCAEGAFRCTSGRACSSDDCEGPVGPCLPRELVCNGVADCNGAEDEAACAGVARPNPAHESVGDGGTMQCSGGLRIPVAWRCDGRKDCPLDGLDELGCGYCGPGEFICPTSGVCIPSEQVCDGSPSLPGCTDEQFCEACPAAHLVCDVCVATWQICDGVWDCKDGEDERECAGVRADENCDPGFYRCPSGRCLPEMSVCDRRVDCPDGDDEKHCLDDNFDVLRYVSVKPSPVGPLSGTPSRLVTPTLQHPKGGVGVLSFKYRLDAWLGASNATISVEIVKADDPNVGVQPWAAWRQSGHKGRHWLATTVLVPPMEDIERYKVAFLVSYDDHGHASHQLHLAQLTFKVVLPDALSDVGSWLLQCEFEDTLCGWSQPTTEGDYSWVFARASPHARRTGPITGYPDGGTSGFIFADSLHGVEGSTADLISPPLMLPQGTDPALCFRFAIFLFGAHVAKVSVHVMQRIGEGTHTAELYHAVGGMGLSWIPVGVTVDGEDLADARVPLVLVVRATRGAGPEADIALDHVSVLAGSCARDPALETNVTLHAVLAHPNALALSAGRAITPAPKTALRQAQEGEVNRASQGVCEDLMTCTSCVTEVAATCAWCDLSQSCVTSLTQASDVCPEHLMVHHNTSTEMRRGEGWCPQILPRQETEVLVAAGSSPVLSFAVQNIQVTQTDSGWICVFEPQEERPRRREEEEEEDEEAEEEGRRREEEWRTNDIPEEGKEKAEIEKKMEEEEEEARKRKKKVELKRARKGWKESREGSLRLPGHFQGRVIDVGGGVSTGVGVGAIKCGDAITELRPHHPPSSAPPAHVHYSVRLITPSGALLDNPGGVKLVVYSCEVLADSCLGCVTVNASLSCGWCETSETCTVHAHCLGSLWYGPGRTCEQESYRKILGGGDDFGRAPLGPHDLGGADVLDDGLGAIGYEREDGRDDIDLDVLENLLDSPDASETSHQGDEEEEAKEKRVKDDRRKNKRKRKNPRRADEGEEGGEEEEEELHGGMEEEEEEENLIGDTKPERIGKLGGSKRAGKSKVKGQVKIGGRGRSFLRLPRHPGLYVARDAWRLHTGRQYYVPVTKKTLVNLGFVRQVTYGSLAEERTRTVLVNGAWKKAAGYFVDLFEKTGQDPVTSVITTSRSVFEQLLGQLLPADS